MYLRVHTVSNNILSVDHTDVLGETIDKIAWHKAGIMKPEVPAITIQQPGTPACISII